MGQIFKWTFIAFNLFMIYAVVAGVMNVAQTPADTGGVLTQDQADGARAVGAGIGLTVLLIVWALGDVVLGLFVLFTRARD